MQGIERQDNIQPNQNADSTSNRAFSQNSNKASNQASLDIAEGSRFCCYCGTKLSTLDTICPNCGCPVKSDFSSTFRLSSKQIQIVAIVSIILFVVIGSFVANRYILWGNDKAAYDMMVSCADNFKDPSSLRLVSGTISNDKEYMWAVVKARNGFGAYSSESYFISANGSITETDADYCNGTDFNVEKINRIYERKYG